MLHILQTNYRRFFSASHERTNRARKNMMQSVLIKAGSAAISFVLLPITIKYVGAANYGIWLTISSVITWAALFDMGLGNGLKNKLSEDIALNNTDRAKNYVSSAYAMLVVISVMLFIVFKFVNPNINWYKILNVLPGTNPDLSFIVLIVFASFCVQFVIQLINNVLTAAQQPALPVLLNFAGQLATLLAVLILAKYTHGSLLYLVLAVTMLPLAVLFAGSLWFYNGSLKTIAPAIRGVKFNYATQLLKTGAAFFIIQIGALGLYETDNIVITQLFGPETVTAFNVAYKLFSLVLMFFVIAISPYWSAFTEAYVKQDHEWIKTAVGSIQKLWLGLSACVLVLLVCSPAIYRLWLGNSVRISFGLSAVMALYTITFIWQAIYVQFLNGIGKMRLQLYLCLASLLFNIPLSIFLGNRIGVAGVTLSNVIVFVVMAILFSIQTKKLLNGTAKGVFNA